MQNYNEQEELDALLGEIEVAPQNTQPKYEVSTEFHKDELQSDILDELRSTVTQSNSAVNAVLTELAMAPGDPAVISAASAFLNAHSKVIGEMQKLYILHEKHQQNKELLAMKLMTDHKINQENNETKIMLTREQAMKRGKAKIVDE